MCKDIEGLVKTAKKNNITECRALGNLYGNYINYDTSTKNCEARLSCDAKMDSSENQIWARKEVPDPEWNKY